MILRKAESKDKKNIIEIINLLRLDMPGFVWGEDEFVEKQIQRGEYFLAEIDGKVAGVISMRQKEDKMYIETLAVVKDRRLQGIGSGLVEHAKRHAKEKELSALRACSFFDFNASDFWFKMGFVLLGKPGKYNGRKYHRFEISI